MDLYNNYALKDLKEKIYFWDIIFIQEAKNLDTESMLQFLKDVILDNNETLYCKMRALKEMISWTFLDKIKQRKTISFLLDEMTNSNEELLECYRLKYLALFYQREKQDVKDTLLKKCNEKNTLVKAEAKYQLGLIMFFDSNDMHDKREFLNSIIDAQQVFNEAALIEENRIDAELLSLICSYINSSFSLDLESSKETYQQINELIFEGILLQIDDQLFPFYLNIGQNISRVQQVINKNPHTWIDYKKEFNKLCSDFYALSNFSYKNNDLYMALSDRMNERLKKEIIEPVFKYNYKATLSKIEVILSENDISDQTTSFLKYLKGILLSEDIKEVDYNQEWLKENFPMLTEDDWDSFNGSLGQSNVSGAIYNLLSAMQRLTPAKVLDDIVQSCIKLQANSMYKDCIEDVRNDYIRDILSSQKYQLRDQTRQGTSREGKASGEIDILILDNNMPYSLFEALNLDSLNTSYLKAHIDKIFKYDTLGYEYNFLVSYVKIKDFSSFWSKYIDYIKKYKYPYPLDSFEENVDDKYYYPNLKVASTTLLRNGVTTILYHICVLMQE
ncbi:MAG TPA: hypothetical protein DEQ01_01180 [Thermoanaerobacter sp.]|nr:hypothetical protein [Thermoanaerobacter sp.]